MSPLDEMQADHGDAADRHANETEERFCRCGEPFYVPRKSLALHCADCDPIPVIDLHDYIEELRHER